MSRGLGSKQLLVVGIMIVGLIGAFVSGAYGTHVFTDVPTSAFYHDDVTWLANTGVTAGCGAGKYCPNNPVTRGQMATFLHKLAGSTRTGNFSCDARSFTAVESATAYSHSPNGLYANGEMACAINVPDGATITRFVATFYDNDGDDDESCGLIRSSQSVDTLGISDELAFSGSSGTPGATRLVDISVSTPLVDNNTYSYVALCNFEFYTSNLRLFGVIVGYTYKGVPAP